MSAELGTNYLPAICPHVDFVKKTLKSTKNNPIIGILARTTEQIGGEVVIFGYKNIFQYDKNKRIR